MEFADSQVRPGHETTLRLAASDTRSLCAVAVVDKSIELMGTASQLTKSKVMSPPSITSDNAFSTGCRKYRVIAHS